MSLSVFGKPWLLGLVGTGDVRWDHVPETPPAPPTAGGSPEPTGKQVEPPAEPQELPAGQADDQQDDQDDVVISGAHDDPEDPADPIYRDPRVKALRRDNRKLVKKLSVANPIARHFKGYSPEQVAQVLENAGHFRRIQEAIQAGNTGLVAQMLGIEAPAASPESKPQTPAAKGPKFTAENVPFDVTDERGKFFLNVFNELQTALDELRSQNASLQTVIQTGQQQTVQQAEAARKASWKAVVDQTSTQLPGPIRQLFSLSMKAAFDEATRRKATVDPRQVADKLLANLKKEGMLTTKQAIAAGAAAQRTAEHNQQLPRQPQNGIPAAPRRPGRTLAEVNRMVRTGQIGPAT